MESIFATSRSSYHQESNISWNSYIKRNRILHGTQKNIITSNLSLLHRAETFHLRDLLSK
ncbi:hypothetical protein YC2023_077472 [Brassica napus]